MLADATKLTGWPVRRLLPLATSMLTFDSAETDGIGVGDGVGVGDGAGVGVGVGDGAGVGDGVAAGAGVGVGVGDGAGDGDGVAAGAGDGDAVGAGDGDGVAAGAGDGDAVGAGDGEGLGVGACANAGEPDPVGGRRTITPTNSAISAAPNTSLPPASRALCHQTLPNLLYIRRPP